MVFGIRGPFGTLVLWAYVCDLRFEPFYVSQFDSLHWSSLVGMQGLLELGEDKSLLAFLQTLLFYHFLSDPGVPGVRSMGPDETQSNTMCRLN